MSVLRGVGAQAGARARPSSGSTSVLDLLTHYPRRYIDGTRLVPIAELVEGEKASVLARVTRVSQPSVGLRAGPAARARPGSSSRSPTTAAASGWSSSTRPGGPSSCRSGPWPCSSGPVGTYRGALQLVSPTAEVLGWPAPTADDGERRRSRLRPAGSIPVYPLTEQGQAHLGPDRPATSREALDRAGGLRRPGGRRPWRNRFGLVDRTTAFTTSTARTPSDETEPARRRLAFDELFRLQLALVLRQAAARSGTPAASATWSTGPDGSSPTLVERFVDRPALRAHRGPERAPSPPSPSDLAGPLPMHRLLQGDVGSGKTVVAVAAMLIAVEGGHQGALMAPTEVLAEQHADRGSRAARRA